MTAQEEAQALATLESLDGFLRANLDRLIKERDAVRAQLVESERQLDVVTKILRVAWNRLGPSSAVEERQS
jgi:hypothetical protein